MVFIIGSPDPYFTPKVRVASLRLLEFLSELDTHEQFRYQDERSNPYFEVILKHFQEYVSIIKNFAEFYSPASLERFLKEKEDEAQPNDSM